MLSATALVLLMTAPGLALFYGGMVRQKNALATLMQSFIIMAIISIQWVLWGYSLAFGPDKGGIIGGLEWIGLRGVGAEPFDAYSKTIPHTVFMLFQLMFAIITPALNTGAFAERKKFSAFLLFTVLWSTFVYDPLAHWVWGDGGVRLDVHGVGDARQADGARRRLRRGGRARGHHAGLRLRRPAVGNGHRRRGGRALLHRVQPQVAVRLRRLARRGRRARRGRHVGRARHGPVRLQGHQRGRRRRPLLRQPRSALDAAGGGGRHHRAGRGAHLGDPQGRGRHRGPARERRGRGGRARPLAALGDGVRPRRRAVRGVLVGHGTLRGRDARGGGEAAAGPLRVDGGLISLRQLP